MKIAAYNVENLFDRAKVFNDDTDAHREVLDLHAEINTLFEQPVYSAADKARMLVIFEALGILNDNDGPFVRLRKIRGQVITRPRDRSAPGGHLAENPAQGHPAPSQAHGVRLLQSRYTGP